MRLNVHFHVLWLDGVHAHELGSGRTEFCEHGEVTDGDVAGLVAAIADRVLRLLRRVGKWPATGEAADSAGRGADRPGRGAAVPPPPDAHPLRPSAHGRAAHVRFCSITTNAGLPSRRRQR
ncbi:MAG TPA: hypothetical protein VF384_12115 [Planctomycetota bacterium]